MQIRTFKKSRLLFSIQHLIVLKMYIHKVYIQSGPKYLDSEKFGNYASVHYHNGFEMKQLRCD